MKTERVFVCLFVISLLLKLFHVPGATALITVTLLGLAALYTFFGFYFFSVDNIRGQNLALSIVAGISLGAGVLGILFGLQFWPGVKDMLFSGAINGGFILILTIIVKVFSRKGVLTRYYNNMIGRSAIIFFLVFTLYLLPTHIQARIQHWNDPKAVELLIYYRQHPGDEKAYEDYIRQTHRNTQEDTE